MRNGADRESDKSRLRREFREERRVRFMDESWLHILGSKEFQSVTTVASYHSYGDEPSTADINAELIKRGVRLLLPRLLPDKDLEWVIWDGNENSLAAHGNTFEPHGFAMSDFGSIDCVIVPALRIDRAGNRLGQGGGSYDRALAKINGWKIALVHHGELTSEPFPVEAHDQKVDAAATPDLIARFARL